MRQNYKGDFTMVKRFYQNNADGSRELIPVPDHVRLEFFTPNGRGRWIVERNSDSLQYCTLSEDGTQLICSIALSRKEIGKGPLLCIAKEITPDASFPEGLRVTPIPEDTGVMLWDGPSDNQDTIDSATILAVLEYGYSIYQLAVKYGYKGTEEEFVQEYNGSVTAAREAARQANNAASIANEKAAAADQAAKDARAMAELANEKAGRADERATAANDAAEFANQKAADAETAARGATAAAEHANNAASAASDAAEAAASAVRDAISATGRADEKATAANNAAEFANQKAADAETAANHANDAASAASAAADAATEALRSLQEILATKANISDLKSGSLVPAKSTLATDLEPWDSRSDSPVDSVSLDLIRTTGGDESIKSSGGAVLLGMTCVGEDFVPKRIISSGRNLLRLQSNNGLAIAIGAGFYFPVPKLTATNDSIGTANENNGVLFTDNNGNNLKPTVYFKPLADGTPTSITDGTVATYLDKNGRRHYTNNGPGWLIVSGIAWSNTCAHLAWSTGYDVFTSPNDANDAGTIVNTANIGTLRSVGSGANLFSDRADRISNTQMRKTVNIGTNAALAWTDVADIDDEGSPTGTFTHSATVNAMLLDGIAEIKLAGAVSWIPLSVEGQVVSFSDDRSAVESGYLVKYQLAIPTTSNINVTTVFGNINDWGIEYVDATGDGQGLWQYVRGIPDAVFGLLAAREADNKVIAEAIASLAAEMKAARELMVSYEAALKLALVDAKEYKVMGRPRILRSTTAGAPSVAVIPDNWDERLYGPWKGGAISFEQAYLDAASGKWYKPKSITNTTADWVPMN